MCCDVGNICLAFSLTTLAQTPSFRLQPFLSGLSSPLLATNAKDGSKRLFVVQQGGIIKVVQPGSSAATDFINIRSKIVAGGEQGLLGLAFHPQFAANGYFFVNYTRISDGATVIARYKTTDATNALGDPNSERIVLTIAQPFSNHNGGMIEFRNDNGTDNLYIGMGDGGSGNDPGNRAQNINELARQNFCASRRTCPVTTAIRLTRIRATILLSAEAARTKSTPSV
ncbi:MAG: PQQ-dependent sugar dehydrogenase [Pyrinomonadaceae bacterium]